MRGRAAGRVSATALGDPPAAAAGDAPEAVAAGDAPEGFVYDAFVPSMSLENDFGEEDIFTDVFLYFHQPDPEGGPGGLRRNLTPDEARALFYEQ